MSAPTVKLVELTLDQPRKMRFDFMAAYLFEEKSGKNLLRDNVLTRPSATDILFLVWACLKHEDPDLTVEQVGRHMHLGNIDYLTEKIAELVNPSVPAPDPHARPTTGATG